MICRECKVEINGYVCENCGYKNINKNKKIIIILIIALIAIAFVTSMCLIINRFNNNRNLKLCTAEGKTFSDMLSESQFNINIIGALYSSSTKTDHGYFWDEEYFTNYVTGLCSSEISKEKNNMLNIAEQYEVINNIECSSDKIKEFQKQTVNLYNAYEDMYELIIEQNFTCQNYESKYIQTKNDFDMALELYDSTLKKMSANN